MTSYTVRLPVYEGPLDLLLELIERAELDITKVALAQVTDQYLSYLRQLEVKDPGDLASFLVVAARLLQIKSEALLPRPPERAPGEEDPGDALARQLQLYKRFKEAALLLGARAEAGLRTYLRRSPPPRAEPHLDMGNVHLEDLRLALQRALAATSAEAELTSSVTAPKVRIRQKIRLIFEALRDRGRLTFSSLVHRAQSRLEIVVTFLAVLELIKQRQVQAVQPELFGDIEIVPGEEFRADQGAERELELEFDE
ncbi:MAG TPA: segregation/condensation protein A [Anaerolineales bacterium]|nr:segregation/condensation protein A [Anaerolineales bacterium]